MNHLPHSVRLPRPARRRVLACGAFLKNRACLLDGHQAHWSALHGDLRNPQSRLALTQSIDELLERASGPLQAIAHDLHPGFFSTQIAIELGQRLDAPAIGIQHHQAHIGTVLAEQGINEPVIGVALDGMGWGTDATAWGGEVLFLDDAAHAHTCQRVAHLATLAQPGGDAAAREPWRLAAAVLYGAGRGDEIAPRFASAVGADAARTVYAMLQRGVNCPHSSSAGRWFDAAAGALGICLRQSHEAEAAMALEHVATHWLSTHPDYAFDWRSLDLHPVVAGLFTRQGQGAEALGEGAAQFHLALAAGLAHCATEVALQRGIRKVVLSGGCFANRVLRQTLRRHLERADVEVIEPQWMGCGDEGLALGQAWLAACTDLED